IFFFSSRRRHTRSKRDWSSDVCSSDLFLNALERIPAIIKQYEEKNEVLEREIPQLQEIAGKTWKKEEELKQLKSELSALDRKIQLELAPKQEPVLEEDGKGKESQKESLHAGVSHEIVPTPPSDRHTW